MARPEDERRGQEGPPQVKDARGLDIMGPDIKALLTGRRFTIIKPRPLVEGVPAMRFVLTHIDDQGILVVPDEFGGDTKIAAVEIRPDETASLLPIEEHPDPTVSEISLPEDPDTHVGFFMTYNPVNDGPDKIRTGMVRTVMTGGGLMPLAFSFENGRLEGIPYKLTGATMRQGEQKAAATAGIFDIGFDPNRTRGILSTVAFIDRNPVPKEHPFLAAKSTLFTFSSFLVRTERDKPPTTISDQAGAFIRVK